MSTRVPRAAPHCRDSESTLIQHMSQEKVPWPLVQVASESPKERHAHGDGVNTQTQACCSVTRAPSENRAVLTEAWNSFWRT